MHCLYSIVLFLFLFVFMSCGHEKNKLTYLDREVIGGLYFGMPQDSIEIILKKNLLIDNFRVVNCMGYTQSQERRYVYSNFCDFAFAKQIPRDVLMSSSEPPFEQGHYGLVIPVVNNKRLSEVYVVMGNYSRKDNPAIFRPFMSANLVDEVSYKLQKEYGRDSIVDGTNANIAVLQDGKTNFTTTQSIVQEYKAKFGTVELVRGVFANDVHFSSNIYWCGEGFEYNPNEVVYWFPCLHYKLDPKYFEELGLKEKL